MRIFGTNAKSRDPPSTTAANIQAGSSTTLPTLDVTSSTSAKNVNNDGKLSRRFSSDYQYQKNKEKTFARSQSVSNQHSKLRSADNSPPDPSSTRLDSRTSSGASDPSRLSIDGQRKEKRKKKKKHQDASQEGIRRSSTVSNSTTSSNKGERENSKSVQDASFQDVLNSLSSDNAIDDNPYVVPSTQSRKKSPVVPTMPTVDENKQDDRTNTKLFSESKETEDPSSALQALLQNASNFSSDASVGTVGTVGTYQYALSLGHLIEEMQTEFKKMKLKLNEVKKQKNKAESYAEQLHTDYVRMQEGLERDFEKACEDRDQLKIARQKDLMEIDSLKAKLAASESKNADLKLSKGLAEDRSRKMEEENGRMKIALEALLIRSGAAKKDEFTKRKSKKDDVSDKLHSNEAESLPGSPERRPSKHVGYPKSADQIAPRLDMESQHPKKAVTLPFDSSGKRTRRNSPSTLHNSLACMLETSEEYESHFTSYSDLSNLNFDKDKDEHTSYDSDCATRDDGTMDSPAPLENLR